MALPIPGEGFRLAAVKRIAGKFLYLLAVRQAAVILAPRRFLRIPEKIVPGDMVMMADLGAAHTGEKFLRPIGASAILRIGFLVVDALHFVLGVKLVPC